MPQRIGHGVLTFVSGKVQNLHVQFAGHFFRMSFPQHVPRHPEPAGRKHFFAVLVVGKRTRFSHQRVDDVSIINRGLLLSDQSRHRLNEMSLMRDRDLFSSNAKVDELIDQPTGNRVRVGSYADGAAGTDLHPFDDVVCVEPLIGQPTQMSKIIQELLPPVVVGTFDKIFHEADILFTTVEVPTAAQ